MEPEKKTNGALVGLIIIVIILIVGGIYVWQTKNKGVTDGTDTNTQAVTPEDSSELDTLEQDLNTVDIDVGANAIESVQ